MVYVITMKVADSLSYFSTDVVHIFGDGMTRHLLLPNQAIQTANTVHFLLESTYVRVLLLLVAVSTHSYSMYSVM